MRVAAKLILDRRCTTFAKTILYSDFLEVLKSSDSIASCCEKLGINYKTLIRIVNESTKVAQELFEQLKTRGNQRKGSSKRAGQKHTSEVRVKLLKAPSKPTKVSDKIFACQSKKDLDNLINQRLDHAH